MQTRLNKLFQLVSRIAGVGGNGRGTRQLALALAIGAAAPFAGAAVIPAYTMTGVTDVHTQTNQSVGYTFTATHALTVVALGDFQEEGHGTDDAAHGTSTLVRLYSVSTDANGALHNNGLVAQGGADPTDPIYSITGAPYTSGDGFRYDFSIADGAGNLKDSIVIPAGTYELMGPTFGAVYGEQATNLQMADGVSAPTQAVTLSNNSDGGFSSNIVSGGLAGYFGPNILLDDPFASAPANAGSTPTGVGSDSVPEPASLGIMALGVIGLLARRRR